MVVVEMITVVVVEIIMAVVAVIIMVIATFKKVETVVVMTEEGMTEVVEAMVETVVVMTEGMTEVVEAVAMVVIIMVTKVLKNPINLILPMAGEKRLWNTLPTPVNAQPKKQLILHRHFKLQPKSLLSMHKVEFLLSSLLQLPQVHQRLNQLLLLHIASHRRKRNTHLSNIMLEVRVFCKYFILTL